MSNLEKAKKIIRENISDARHGIFNSRNTVGDLMTTIYYGDGLRIDICYGYAYFEVFGLSTDEFGELVDYYDKLRSK